MKTLTTHSEQLKRLVKEKYSQIAEQSKEQNESSCCGAGRPADRHGSGCGTLDTAIMAEDYTRLEGYVSEADLGLGCGLPTEFALIKESDTVLDLGSGAGNDAFVARSITGISGRVIGVDFTEKMISKARTNAEKLGYNNVEFRQGDIEHLPVNDSIVDVVVSNCVLNLVPDKHRAFAETFRVLKPGGHFSVSDIVLDGKLPEELHQSAEMYAGCVAGAIQKETYLNIIKDNGFINVQVQKNRKITLPDEIVAAYLNEEELKDYKAGESGIYSITVYGEKPGHTEKTGAEKIEKQKISIQEKADRKAACCGTDSECC